MADDSRLSSVLDDEGRLFGVVNVIDALVVLVVIALLIAGFALLTPGTSDTRYATIDLGAQPDHTAAQITPGDEWDVDGGLTITDVYMYPADEDADGDTNVMVRAAVNGTTIDAEQGDGTPISFNGDPLRFDRQLTIETVEWAAEGTVVDIGPEDDSLETVSEDLVVQTIVDPTTAQQVQPGDTYTVGDTELLSVQSVTVYPTATPNERRVVLGVTAAARLDDSVPLFGDQPIQAGTTLPVRTGAYSLTGDVVNTGSLEEPGTPATRTATITIDSLPQDQADRLSVGMTEAVGDVQTAEVVAVDSQPREEVVQSGGEYQVIEHPRNREVTLTVDIDAYNQNDGTVRFRGAPLRIDDDVTFTLDAVTVQGELTSIE
jgi:hypothetical protein